MERRPKESYALVFFGPILVATLIIWLAWRMVHPALIWLACSTVVTFVAFGYDKAIAGSKSTRVPEIVLLALTFFGGTIGALAGRALFRHKTRKVTFRRRFWAVIGIQILLLVVVATLFRPDL
jgi:uncharacterized membrane protein YsdA (DUF1294 family)